MSDRFPQFIEALSLPDVEFVSLPSQPKHYWFRVHSVLQVDTQTSVDLRQLYFCDMCEKYAGVFGTRGLKFREID